MPGALSRRMFIRNVAAAGLAGTAGVLHPSCAATNNKADALQAVARESGGPEDEAYWSLVRRCFVLDPNITHMNNGTLGPMPGFVLQGLQDRMLSLARDPNMSLPCAARMGAQLEETRKKMARMVRCDPEEIAFTRNTTEGMSIIAAGLSMKRGEEVLTTDHEHTGGLACWEHKAAQEGVVVKKVTLPIPPKSDQEIVDLFEQAVTPMTRVISLSHVTCTTGMRLPVKEIIRMAHARNILVCVDGAQVLGWMDLDLKDLDCDFYTNSPHKWLLSPIGTGFLYVKNEHAPSIKASIISSGWDRKKTARKFETFGTRNLPEAVAVGDAVDFINAIGIEKIEKRDFYLAARLRKQLQAVDGVTLLSSMEDRLSSPLTSILLNRAGGEKLASRDVHRALFNKHRIQVRRIGEADLGAIRISTHIYNNAECIDKLVSAVREIAANGV